MNIKINYNLFTSYFSVFFINLGLFIDIEFLFLLIPFFYIHLIKGLKGILFDYLHIKKINYLLITFLRILLVINLLQIISFFY